MAFLVDKHIGNIQAEDLDEIIKYDQECFGFERAQFLKPWLQLPKNKNFKFVENNKICGFCIVRKVDKGFKIGPLFADNSTIAEELYKASLNAVIGPPLYLDIPIINSDAVQMVKKHNAQYVFECARMYNGKTPKISMNKVFGITSFELG